MENQEQNVGLEKCKGVPRLFLPLVIMVMVFKPYSPESLCKYLEPFGKLLDWLECPLRDLDSVCCSGPSTAIGCLLIEPQIEYIEHLLVFGGLNVITYPSHHVIRYVQFHIANSMRGVYTSAHVGTYLPIIAITIMRDRQL